MRRIALLAALLAVVTAGAVHAAGGTLTATPSSVALGGSFTLAGCGYPVPTSISFEVTGPRKSGIHYFTAGEPLTDPSGCFSEGWTAWWGVTGAYQITSYYRDSKGATHKSAVVKLTVTQ